LVLIGGKRSPQGRLHSKDVEYLWGNGGGFNPLGNFPAGKHRGLEAHGRHLGENLILGLKLAVIRRGEPPQSDIFGGVALP
jgi:hypothetical protein